MDRLSTLIAGCLIFAACEPVRRRPTPGTERVNAVRSAPKKAASAEVFCDVYSPPAGAATFKFPELAESAPPPSTKGWRWINVWATWCKPCIEEMPTLLRWQHRLSRDRTPVALEFLSVDENAEIVRAFRKQHADTPDSFRVKNSDDLEPWVLSLGLDANAAIPIHAFVSDGKLRCVRVGALGPGNFDAVKALLTR